MLLVYGNGTHTIVSELFIYEPISNNAQIHRYLQVAYAQFLTPARAKSPLHKRSLCNRRISLSNADGLSYITPSNHRNYIIKTMIY